MDDMKAKGKNFAGTNEQPPPEKTTKTASKNSTPDNPTHKNPEPDKQPNQNHTVTKKQDPIAEQSTRKIELIPIESIKPNPNQPRKNLNEETIKELAASIEANTLIQPILVHRNEDKTHTLIAGQQRLAAVSKLGHETIEAIITTSGNDEDNVILAMTENLQRSDLSKLEEADCYDALRENFKLSEQKIAKRIGKSREYVAKIRQLKKFSPEVKKLLKEEKTKYTNLAALERLKKDHPESFKALSQEETITAKLIEQFTNNPGQPGQNKKREKPAAPELDYNDINILAVTCQSDSLTDKNKHKTEDENTKRVIIKILELMPDKTQAAAAILLARKVTAKREKELLFPPE